MPEAVALLVAHGHEGACTKLELERNPISQILIIANQVQELYMIENKFSKPL